MEDSTDTVNDTTLRWSGIIARGLDAESFLQGQLSQDITTVGPDGQFHFKSVPPGEYKLFAWEDVESGAWLDPDFIKPLDDKGKSVTIRADGQENADLVAISADTPPGKQ